MTPTPQSAVVALLALVLMACAIVAAAQTAMVNPYFAALISVTSFLALYALLVGLRPSPPCSCCYPKADPSTPNQAKNAI